MGAASLEYGPRLPNGWTPTTAPIIERLTYLSQAVVNGGTVYLAVQIGEPGEDVSSQTKTALAQIGRLLEQAGSDRSRILSATIWLADMANFDAVNAVWDTWID